MAAVSSQQGCRGAARTDCQQGAVGGHQQRGGGQHHLPASHPVGERASQQAARRQAAHQHEQHLRQAGAGAVVRVDPQRQVGGQRHLVPGPRHGEQHDQRERGCRDAGAGSGRQLFGRAGSVRFGCGGCGVTCGLRRVRGRHGAVFRARSEHVPAVSAGRGTRRAVPRRRPRSVISGTAPRPGMSHSRAAVARARGTVTRVPRNPCQAITAAISSGLSAAPALPPTEKIDIEAPRRRLCATEATTEPAGWNKRRAETTQRDHHQQRPEARHQPHGAVEQAAPHHRQQHQAAGIEALSPSAPAAAAAASSPASPPG